jgi:ComF family protein
MSYLKFKEYINILINLFYPSNCNGCGNPLLRNEFIICTICLGKLPINDVSSFLSLNKEKYLGRMDIKHFYAYLIFTEGGVVQHLLHRLKYKNEPEIGTLLGNMCATKLKNEGIDWPIDVVIPMPIHKNKLKIRGYNQCMSFSEAICKQFTNWKLDTTIVEKTIFTQSQTKQSKEKRLMNIKNTFKINNPEKIFDKHILLIDDVITTGATFEALIEELTPYNPKSISILTMAQAKF